MCRAHCRQSRLCNWTRACTLWPRSRPGPGSIGRLGRLLIVFLLHAEGVLRQPLLYLSLYFKRHRSRYYELLQSVRNDGNWEEWIEFFLEGVIEVYDTERHLLYVACTRAREFLHVSGVAPASEFLADFAG